MKFVTGARVKEAVFTIVPSRKVTLPDGSMSWSQPLRAVFRDHRFNSETAARSLGWTPEQQKQVEEGLQKHRRFGQKGGRGIFVDRLARKRAPASAAEADAVAEAEGKKRRCLYFGEDADGETIQCSDTVDPDFPERDLCVKHREELDALVP